MKRRLKRTGWLETRRSQGFKDGYEGRPFRYNKLKKQRRKKPHSASNNPSDIYYCPTYKKAYERGVRQRKKRESLKSFMKGLVFFMSGLFVVALLLAFL